MQEVRNKINKYLDKEEKLIFKRLIINSLFDVIKKTDLGYYYNFSKISNIINNKIEEIFISEDSIRNLLILQDKVLIIDKVFANFDFKNKEELTNVISKEEYLLIKIKEFGLNLIGNNKLNSSLKEALALYFASNKEKIKKNFYDRKYYTALPFMDLKENIINTLSIFVDDNTLAQALCYGDLNLSDKLDNISNHRGTLKNITKFLDRISLIQNKISVLELNYAEIENMYFQVLIKINTINESKNDDQKVILLEEIYDIYYLLKNSDIYKKLVVTMQDDLKPLFKFNEKNNLVKKLEILLQFIQQEINKTLIILDKEYITMNDFIVNNILTKHLKSKKINNYDETFSIFKNLDYQIEGEYSYLEESKATKKLKKRLEKINRH